MNKGKYLIVFNLIAVILLYVPKNLLYSTNVNISAGIGILELVNAGFKLQWEQVQTGAYIGAMQFGDEKIFSLGGDLYFHFGDTVKYTSTKPWYVRTGISYFSDAFPHSKDKLTFLNFRFGRDLNISPKVGIDVELGTLIKLSHKVIEGEPFFLFDLPIWPAIGACIFFRL